MIKNGRIHYDETKTTLPVDPFLHNCPILRQILTITDSLESPRCRLSVRGLENRHFARTWYVPRLKITFFFFFISSYIAYDLYIMAAELTKPYPVQAKKSLLRKVQRIKNKSHKWDSNKRAYSPRLLPLYSRWTFHHLGNLPLRHDHCLVTSLLLQFYSPRTRGVANFFFFFVISSFF